MNERQPTPDLVTARWHKSSYSAANNECVEVAQDAAHVNIRLRPSSASPRACHRRAARCPGQGLRLPWRCR
ncbi:DUF397 domain-containing protein [Streptomyces tendae]